MRKNPADQRELLAAAVLHVRSGRANSRSALADLMGLSRSTAGLYVDQLIASGHLNESGLEQGATGRPKRMLATAPSAGWFAGVEFNAERVQAVRVDFSGQATGSQTKPLPSDPDTRTVLREIKAAVTTLSKNAAGPLLAIGAGAPGVVDPNRGVGLHYAFIPDWKNIPIAKTLRDRFQAPVTVDNNLRAIALAEKWFGGGRDLDDYAILGPRAGFGIALVQQGRLTRGAHHAAGEIGLWPWPSTKIEKQRENGQLHDGLSAPAIWRRLTGVSVRAATPPDLRDALSPLATATSPQWNEIIAEYARALGCVQLLLDLEAYFLHGPLTVLGARFCKSIETEATRLIPSLAANPLKIVPSSLNDEAGALGAASMAMEAWMPG
jgi:predicted NBD/HSP70 family sugar kinase